MTDALSADCIFCAILRRDSAASFVYEDGDTVAFMDIRPVQPGHTLVVPREHAQYMYELSDGTLERLWSTTMGVYRAMWTSGISMDALNIVVADGAAASQEVPHVHVHLVPRTRNDGFGFRFPEGYGFNPPRATLDTQAAQIRTAMRRE